MLQETKEKQVWQRPEIVDMDARNTTSGGDLNPWENPTTSTLQVSS